ncbi:helix-turn-helix domain-containing protein [Planotetraspora kaengkrachanensis]|uniref:MerR family transcriptional regulator n=1 Tax=Planotetraspora kaengkrachanensis TaxID=575193 RepID=A0A8J3M4R8_9ACTN|nr:MerR family transcriptional regulator [Planotetraspora kaengkrachanensis]GIG77010.1 MerR family transcriptional regulator [Planotetraspora kaengkrachanensis]
MSEKTRLYTIGQLARRTELPVRTIRFWSDIGLIPPAGRSAGGYRLYDAEAVSRADLVRTLRDLGVGLESVREILLRQTSVAEVAQAHVRALDAEIRTLRLRRAVLRTVAERGGTTEETLLMHKLALLSVRERRQIIDDFVDRVTAGVDLDADAAVIAQWMRELPDDPAPEQVDAWIELAELVGDEEFQLAIRRLVTGGETGRRPESAYEVRASAVQFAGRALAEGVAPGSPEGRAVLERIVSPDLPVAARAELRQWLEPLADARVERYWRLLDVLNGREPSPPAVPALEWVIAALRVHG